MPIQPDGTINLPTLWLTGVAAISIGGIELDPATYWWHRAGYIHRHNAGQPYTAYPLWPLEDDTPFREYPSALARHANVTYTHGYDTLPAQVATVGLELASKAMELPAGLATQITAGPHSITFGALGVVLSDARVAGYSRPEGHSCKAMALAVYPTAITVEHLVWTPDAGTDSRGNPTGAFAAPVTRQIIGFYRPGSTDPITIQMVARTVSELVMLCYDPTDYNKLDQVQAFDGAETLTFLVQQQPISWATGYPWRRYAALLAAGVVLAGAR